MLLIKVIFQVFLDKKNDLTLSTLILFLEIIFVNLFDVSNEFRVESETHIALRAKEPFELQMNTFVMSLETRSTLENFSTVIAGMAARLFQSFEFECISLFHFYEDEFIVVFFVV